MFRFGRILLFALLACGPAWTQEGAESRGIWVTPRAGAGVWSEAEIARAMDEIAQANFNIVYFNVWSRGWTLWKSQVFYGEGGFECDPALRGRDLLSEAVRHARRNGLRIEAWLEYGFIGWWTGNNMPQLPKGPILQRHPDWAAMDLSGSESFPSGTSGAFHWLNHNHEGAQRFLVDLCRELARNYDLDGIELDRVRYPQLDCGYDPRTRSIYAEEHGGAAPPENPADPDWMRWRADRLVEFQAQAYDAIKAENPRLVVSNAPSHYSAGDDYPAYDRFLQDWRAWLRRGKLDAAQVQMYVRPSDLARYIPSALKGLDPQARGKVYAGIASKTGSFTLTPEETVELVEIARRSGLRGNSFWYYGDLASLGYFRAIRENAYPTKVPPAH